MRIPDLQLVLPIEAVRRPMSKLKNIFKNLNKNPEKIYSKLTGKGGINRSRAQLVVHPLSKSHLYIPVDAFEELDAWEFIDC